MLQCQQHLFRAFCVITNLWWPESTSIFFAQKTSCVERYDIIFHPFHINSQYFKTWGVDSPAEVARCLMAQWFGGSSSRDYRAQESIFALYSVVKPFIQNTIKKNKRRQLRRICILISHVRGWSRRSMSGDTRGYEREGGVRLALVT